MSPDIQSKIQRDFPTADAFAAIEEIGVWDAERKGLLDDRLVRCAVYLAQGNLDALKKQIALGKVDYRDLIMAAEYDGEKRLRDLSVPFRRAVL